MYLPVNPQPSCALAWLEATRHVDGEPGNEAHNVIVGVIDPVANSPVDQAIISKVDAFLRAHNRGPVRTVANTIFPEAIYARHGSPGFYDAYLEKVYPRIKRSQGDWGRYFERMISFPHLKKGKPINPLRDIVDKMKQQIQAPRCYKNVYELTVYDPIRDAGPVMNRQCLSFLSFKLTDETPRTLLLTALYRNHYYIQRLLGNLLGLGRLMRFVADETGVAVGDLTVVSTHAEIDNAGSRGEIAALLKDCAALAKAPAHAAQSRA